MNQSPYKVFVVEDNEWYNKLLVHSLSLNPDYEVHTFYNGAEALQHLHLKPNVITLDYKLPDMDGTEVLKKIKDFNTEIEVIIISEQDSIETAVELLKIGAYDYIVKSKDIRERLLNTVQNLRKKEQLVSKVNILQKEVEQKYDFQKTIIGSSAAIKRAFELIEKAVTSNITVSVYGETGTGKEVVAKAIHYNSLQKNKPFVAVNVAAIPKELIESELFGHEKGAFTGAAFKRIGKFEEANKGTLFLDEIAELDISLQAKILRVIQEKEVTPIGSNKVIKIDCRIIVATHKNLLEEVQKGSFREDLYYRLLGLTIQLPPLRERDNDVIILAKHFITKFCNENNFEEKKLTTEAQKKLRSYSFPGNIRELKSVVDLAIVLSNDNEIKEEHLQLNSANSLSHITSGELTMRDYNFKILDLFLKKYNNDIPLVAEKLDISSATIYRMIKERKENLS